MAPKANSEIIRPAVTTTGLGSHTTSTWVSKGSVTPTAVLETNGKAEKPQQRKRKDKEKPNRSFRMYVGLLRLP